jgi:hypothetical protein
MANRRRADWDDDDWGTSHSHSRGRTGGKPGPDIILDDQAELDSPYLDDNHHYGRNNDQRNNSELQPVTSSTDPHRLPARAPAADPKMDPHRRDYDSPWYRKKRTWTAVALVIVIVIVVPIAVTVTRNKKHGDSYPNYNPVNYTLLETCKSSTRFRIHIKDFPIDSKQILERTSSITSTISPDMTLVRPQSFRRLFELSC